MSRASKLRAKRALVAPQSTGSGTPAIPLDHSQKWRNPPNDGAPVIQHIDMFAAKASSFAQTYFNPDEAYKENKTLQRAMQLDPVVMEPLRARQLAVALLDWSVKPEDEENEIQKAWCGKFERSIRSIPYFTKYRMALLEAVWFGRYGVQNPWVLGWDGPTSSPVLNISRDSRERWLPVHGDKFRIKHTTDQTARRGSLGVLVRHGDRQHNRVGHADESQVQWLSDEQRDCYVFHQHEILDADFFDPVSAGAIMGLGLRHRVWWPWFFKQSVSGWVHDFVQRIGTGITIYYFDQDNPESYLKVEEAAKKNGNGSILLVPRGPEGKTRGSGVERLEPNTGGAQFIQSILVDYWCKEIKMMIAGQTLTSETGATGLGSNVADKHADTKAAIQAYDAQNLDETLTLDLLGPMSRYPTTMPSFKLRFESAVSTPDPQKMMAAAQQFFNMGGEVSEDELRDTAGLRKPRHGEKTLSKSKQAQGAGDPSEMPQPGGEEQPDGDADDHAWLDSMFGEEEPAEEPVGAGAF